MRILGISGSPRPDGNSDFAARRCLESLSDIGQTEFVRVHDHDIRHCLGCRKCMRLMRCAVRGDDFERLFRRWKQADVLIISSPVYWLSPPGAMKDFIDRSHGVYGRKDKPFEGKKAGIVSLATESGFATHERIFTAWLSHYGAEVIGKVRLFARERDDLANSLSELRKLDAFIRRLKLRLSRRE